MLAKKSDTAMDEEVKQEDLNGIQDLFNERWLQNMDASKMLLGVEIAWEEGRGWKIAKNETRNVQEGWAKKLVKF